MVMGMPPIIAEKSRHAGKALRRAAGSRRCAALARAAPQRRQPCALSGSAY
jgi:hypothetical protein